MCHRLSWIYDQEGRLDKSLLKDSFLFQIFLQFDASQPSHVKKVLLNKNYSWINGSMRMLCCIKWNAYRDSCARCSWDVFCWYKSLAKLWITGLCTLSIALYSKAHKRTERFGNWICFRPRLSGWGASTLQWLRLALSNGSCRLGVSHPLIRGRKQIRLPICCALLCFLEHRTMDRVQKLSNPECYTPSPEPVRIQKSLISLDNLQFSAQDFLWINRSKKERN
jgi:hypothetical protein